MPEGTSSFILAFACCRFVSNRADYGGALSAADCTAVTITSSAFEANAANAAGALALSQVISSAAISNTTFISNQAALNSSSSTDPCGRYGYGGGGAVCATLYGSVTMRGLTFARNRATNGGALYVKRVCSVTADSACGSLMLNGSNAFNANEVGVFRKEWLHLLFDRCRGHVLQWVAFMT